MPPNPLEIKAGLPASKDISVTLPTGRDWWLERDDFEVVMQVRESPNVAGILILDLTKYLTITMSDANTVEIHFFMTGQDTRQFTRGGYYDMIMSDPGVTDARAEVILYGPVRFNTVVSSGKEEVNDRPHRC